MERGDRGLEGNSKPNHPPPKSTVAKSSRNSLRRESQADAITVIAKLRRRVEEVIDDEYISVESASVLGGDQVVVDGLEIPSDRAVADLEAKGVSTGGALGTSRDSVTNPAFQGRSPNWTPIDMKHTPAGRR